MAASRLLMALRDAVYRAWDFNQCCVTSDLRNVSRTFSNKSVFDDVGGVVTEKKQRPKTVPVPKITLLSPDDRMTVTVLEEAQRLAKRRKFVLVKISDLDSKTQRPVYKLTSSILDKEEDVTENVEADGKDKQRFKETKIFFISAKIAENDLLTKTKNMVKLLEKEHKVKIVITLDGISERMQ
ncbi:uncharacterized protein LOC114943158 isoform X2 [Nylanderia fulva]|uniref:uncharacterized protein LOC114943158 isoform X2 n=1 Tax=Nylanderia fulva TaxID=613905 RepID=UPI0010FBA35E|nr:uncharacterized protein LOC114943158 isoform X2 [Nylanderia fulva]